MSTHAVRPSVLIILVNLLASAGHAASEMVQKRAESISCEENLSQELVDLSIFQLELGDYYSSHGHWRSSENYASEILQRLEFALMIRLEDTKSVSIRSRLISKALTESLRIPNDRNAFVKRIAQWLETEIQQMTGYGPADLERIRVALDYFSKRRSKRMLIWEKLDIASENEIDKLKVILAARIGNPLSLDQIEFFWTRQLQTILTPNGGLRHAGLLQALTEDAALLIALREGANKNLSVQLIDRMIESVSQVNSRSHAEAQQSLKILRDLKLTLKVHSMTLPL